MKPLKKPGGRKAGFNTKSIDGLGIWQIAKVASQGDAVLTSGGKIAEQLILGVVGLRIMPGAESTALYNSAGDSLLKALLSYDSKVFREIAAYLDAAMRSRPGRDGPAHRVLAEAAYFVGFCQNNVLNFRMAWTAKTLFEQSQCMTLVKAWKRKPFTPTVQEIHAYIRERIRPAPSHKTTERAALLLGIAPRKRSGLK